MTYIFSVDFNPPTVQEQILEYLARHPKSMHRQIRTDLGLASSTLSLALSKLRQLGEVMRVGDNNKTATWELGCDASPKVDMKAVRPRQQTVSEWEPSTVRDPMIDLLFGRQV